MNLADQIEAVARRATRDVVAASHEFSETQRRLTAELAEFRAEHHYVPDDATEDATATSEAGPRSCAPAE
ncbi:hypothetical protein [Gordonia rhizosphera]|uniref:Uncharacterized protein n=1 Tax=Gordonia rhizosphera NBRC 16068 TaxID=1108045 RepID=K6V1P1_9ACTN|nr:hypothetical protein [Gordonia rhizosphera]GAB89828.1 hypothetical protein GORHZ_072_00040 [Gordonia rhizosphera NBRC 16068]